MNKSNITNISRVTFEQNSLASRPTNPKNGVNYTDLNGQIWEFINGRWMKMEQNKLARMVRK